VIRVVVTTPKTHDEYTSSVFYRCLNKIIENDSRVVLQIISNNNTGLPKVYSDVIQKSEEDIVTFIHDDLEIHDAFFVDKIIKAHESLDIVGLAGAQEQEYTDSKYPVWHLSAPRDKMCGFVSHSIKTDNSTYINSAYFGPTPNRTVVVDGVLMSFVVEKVKNKKIFDESFTFHFYDMSTCLNANAMGLKIGVWPIFVIHHGLGNFLDDPIWDRESKTFLSKFALDSYKI